MKTFYKINQDGTAARGSGTVVPEGFIGYTKGQEPQGLLEALKIEQYNLSKTNKYNYIQTIFDTATTAIADVLPHEMATWRDQEDEARAYIADDTVDTPVLSPLVEARELGETVEELANKVIANADAYRTAYYPLLGKYQSLIKQVDSATTVEELEAIVW